MYFFDFLSQYKRVLEGNVSAPDFAHWLFAYSDDMEDALSPDEWDAFLQAQHLAAEWTGDVISERQFRDRLSEVWSATIVPLTSADFSHAIHP